jgi:hypothetical protein
MPNIDLNGITDFIISEVQENATDLSNGLNYVVDFAEIEERFKITVTAELAEEIADSLSIREEVADVIIIDNDFDILLYGKYAPDFIKSRRSQNE